MNLVIVESPAKASTINKYLGAEYKVLASYGHVRDLPEKDGSVAPDDDFAMQWEAQPRAAKPMQEILAAAKSAQSVILATDPDREGEAIAWHVLELLKQKKLLGDKQISRVVFHAITRQAVLDAIAEPRQLNQNLVDAYLARRALDYLVGFTLSPVLWRKLPGSRSAGRVQSVALRLICARELEIEAFETREYWSVEALMLGPKGERLPTRLVRWRGEKLERFSLANQDQAEAAKADMEQAAWRVADIARKEVQRKPTPPFTTSTLQQEAARKLGFSARQTMQVAQKLYEGITLDGENQGLITYMRTDSQQVAPEAAAAMRAEIARAFGKDYVPAAPRQYRRAQATAQEAHEAIRPVAAGRHPQELARHLPRDAAALYRLIWQRALASQMENARLARTVIDIASADNQLGVRAHGSVIVFPGFLKLYEEGRDDEPGADARSGDAQNADAQTADTQAAEVRSPQRPEDTILPALAPDAALQLGEAKPIQHFTEPPPRYNEASLVKKMEELGIGRPSTYAGILSVLRDRDYVFMERKRFHPHDKGLLVVAFLENFFGQYVEYDFTAELENALDRISNGGQDWRDVLRQFWKEFSPAVEETLSLRNSQVLDRMNDALGQHIFRAQAEGADGRQCPQCTEGQLSLKTSRFGAFIGCTRYPDCRFTRPFAGTGQTDAVLERELGKDPETQDDIWLKTGRFGPYVQRGSGSKDAPPKRVKLPDGVKPNEVELALALQLLALPREVGAHPESGEPITANLGRYGPYLRHGKQSARLENLTDVLEIGVNRAVSLLNEQQKSPRRSSGRSNVLRDLGAHPEGGAVHILDGRYGPYVRHNNVNASLPSDQSPDDVDMEQAVQLLEARRKAPKRRKPFTRRKASAFHKT